MPHGVVCAMKDRFLRIYAATPYKFQWRSSESVQQGESCDDLTVIRMAGTSAVDPPTLCDERGSLA